MVAAFFPGDEWARRNQLYEEMERRSREQQEAEEQLRQRREREAEARRLHDEARRRDREELEREAQRQIRGQVLGQGWFESQAAERAAALREAGISARELELLEQGARHGLVPAPNDAGAMPRRMGGWRIPTDGREADMPDNVELGEQ